MSLWNDPLKIAPIIISALILFVAIINFLKNYKFKSLCYTILIDAAIPTIYEDLAKNIKLIDQENPENLIPINGVRLLIIELLNDGNVSIKSADFEEAISVSFDSNINILHAEILDSPDSLEKPGLKISENTVVLEPSLINKGDYIRIKLLTSGSRERSIFRARKEGLNVKIRARIVDIKDIKNKPKAKLVKDSPILFMTISMFLGVFLGIFIIKSNNLIYSIIIAILVFASGITLITQKEQGYHLSHRYR
jgi:hypothetical protein